MLNAIDKLVKEEVNINTIFDAVPANRRTPAAPQPADSQTSAAPTAADSFSTEQFSCSLDCQRDYWDSVAPVKAFTNEIAWPQWRRFVPPESAILDVGCGYGRTCSQLFDAGYRNLIGVDISFKMIERGKTERPDLDLRFWSSDTLPFSDDSFDAVCLIAVLTCIPSNSGQQRLAKEIRRVLKPGGVLFVSDFPIQKDERNQARYQQFARKFGMFGVFELPEGTVLRHHEIAWLDELFASCSLLERQSIPCKTMNGHNINLEQRFYRK